jgi:hypothetical protein
VVGLPCNLILAGIDVARGDSSAAALSLLAAGLDLVSMTPEGEGAEAAIDGPRLRRLMSGENMSSLAGSGGGKIARADSPIWQDLKPYRGGTRTNGQSGKARRYYWWDNTHRDIEVYDSVGRHLGSMDPKSGDMTKPPVPGRRIRL